MKNGWTDGWTHGRPMWNHNTLPLSCGYKKNPGQNWSLTLFTFWVRHLTLLKLVFCCVAVIKSLPVHHSADYFISSGIIKHILVILKIKYRLALLVVCSLANYTAVYEETQSKRVWFSRFCVFFVSKGNPFWLLFYSTTVAGVVLVLVILKIKYSAAMKRLNQTNSILCDLCFQRQSFLTFILLYWSWYCAVWRP